MLNNERLPNGNRYYYLFDGLGSIVGLTDGSGNKVNSYDYDPYGVMLKQTEGVSNPFKYAAGYLDASGYYQFGLRYYDPSLGRWTQQDPAAGSLFDLNSGNAYTYVEDDPVNLVDPHGKNTQQAINCVVALIGNVFILFGADLALAPFIVPLGFTPIGVIAFILAALGGAAYLIWIAYQNCGQYISS